MRLRDGFSEDVIFEMGLEAPERVYKQRRGKALRQRRPAGMFLDDSSRKPPVNPPGWAVSTPVLGFVIAPEEMIIKYSGD